jgi:hypothetical protein
MKFKGKPNGTNIICIGSLDQEIFDKGILAVFEGLLGFRYHNSISNAYKYYGANYF